MSLLEKLIFSTQRSKRTGCVIVYTHAKRSTVALCQALKSAGAEVIFCPVNYSLESTRLDELRDSGVRVVETENELASYDRRYLASVHNNLNDRLTAFFELLQPDIAVKLYPGELLFFDNRSLIHARTPYNDPERVNIRVRIEDA